MRRPLEVLPIIVLLTIIAMAALRGRPHGLWIGLGIGLLLTLIYVIVSLARYVTTRMRRGYLVMLRDLTTAEPGAASLAEARKLADTILASPAGAYAEELQGLTSFVQAAQGTSDVGRLCRLVLFRHAPWSRELERDIAAMRYQLTDEEYAPWLEWFLNVRAGSIEFPDRIADAAMYALPRIAEPERTALLERARPHADERASWRRFAQLFPS